MNDADIGFLPASELATRYRDKSLSPVEVIDAVLRHIERQEPSLNAMARLTADIARDAAKRAEAAFCAAIRASSRACRSRSRICSRPRAS